MAIDVDEALIFSAAYIVPEHRCYSCYTEEEMDFIRATAWILMHRPASSWLSSKGGTA